MSGCNLGNAYCNGERAGSGDFAVQRAGAAYGVTVGRAPGSADAPSDGAMLQRSVHKLFLHVNGTNEPGALPDERQAAAGAGLVFFDVDGEFVE